MPPRLQLTALTIGTSQPRELAHFYARLLGWRVTVEEDPMPGEPPEAGWARLDEPEGPLHIGFEYEHQYVRPVWPAEPGAQIATQHLDIQVDDLTTAVEWALKCGATKADFQPQDDVRVMFDPDGHPFCLFLAL